MVRGFAFALLLLAACFTPSTEQGLPCSESGDCPGQQSCENGVCWAQARSVVAIAAGSTHTCAVLDNGALRCWGDGRYGRLGYGNVEPVGDDETPASLGSVNVGGTVAAVGMGSSHTCALLTSGAVRCWGAGSSGRLGYADTVAIGDDEVPASAGDVAVGGAAKEVTAAYSHTCALLQSGSVRCWGAGSSGRLGYGNIDDIGDNELPEHAGDVDIGATAVAVKSSNGYFGAHTCAVLDGGAVRCWGQGESGRLGYGNISDIGDDEVPASAGDVDVGGSATQVATGGSHTCALLDSGAVRCWGLARWAALGYGNRDDIGDDEVPATAGDVYIGGAVTELVAGGSHTCALLDSGAVRCWGQASEGQLGYGDTRTIGDDLEPAVAGDVDVGGIAIQLTAGDDHTCALLDTGSVRCWGSGAYGRLGYGNLDNIGDDETPASAGDVPVL